MPDIGMNFSPTQGSNAYGTPNGARAGSPASPVMDAIKILSFRVPQMLGATAPVAQPLIGGAGGNAGSGLDNSAMVLNWLNRFFGPGRAAVQPVPAWNPIAQDWNAMPGMSGQNAPAGPDPNAMGAGSSLPGAQTPPPSRPAITFPTTVPNLEAPPAPPSQAAQGIGKFDTPDFGSGFGRG